MRVRMAVLLSCALLAGCKFPGTHNLPPAVQLMHPGPGVDGPGPGVMMPTDGMASDGSMCGGLGGGLGGPATQIAFVGPEGTQVTWDISAPGAFDSEPLVFPGRYNFPQGAIYRLRLTNIPGHPGVELYPTIEVAPTLPRTEAYLAHNAVPVQFTEEDIDQVLTGNFVTKVIYLPDAEFQDLAIAGVETLVSTRLDPGVDPIVEADRRGAILAIVRIGNKDLQVPTPDMGDLAMMGGGVVPAGYPTPPPGPISGVDIPEYGMPMCGTPIGLPGPPHVPLGGPAGLQKHVIRNHTKHRIPHPTRRFVIDVKQKPGFSYPKPVNHLHIKESTVGPPAYFRQPLGERFQVVH